LAYATYELGKYLWSRRTGLLAAFLTLTTPMLVSQFKEFQIDGPLTAVTALSLLFLLKSERFTNQKYSLLFGASFGVGMLTKWTFPFIMLAPLALVAVQGAIGFMKSKDGKILYNAVAAAVLAYAIAGVWYVTNFWRLKIDLAQNSTTAGALEGDPVVGTFASNIWHVTNLTDNYLRLAAVLFVIGLVFMFIKRKNFAKNIYLLLLVVGSILFFTMLRNKDARYIAPVMPAVAILCVYWFDRLKERWRDILSVSVLIYGAFVFWSVSFGVPFMPNGVFFQAGNQTITLYAQRGYLIGAPTREDWRQEEAVKYVSDQGDGKVLRYIGQDTVYFNGWGLWYYCVKYRVTLADFEQDPDKKQKPDYILTRTFGDRSETDREGSQVKSYRLPDGSMLHLFKM
jgi:4-amino-4-deoxy-L-arabinose transferase-like glycosyltransferase